MIDVWVVVRFLHVLGAALWVGGQITISLVALPVVPTSLALHQRAAVVTAVGRRFARITTTVFVPLQSTTGVLLAWQAGVTWQSLLEPGYGRVLVAKLVLFVLVMVAASMHGTLHRAKAPRAAKAASTAALVGSLGVVLLATCLVQA
ncbi:CopD family protein [Saccharopolyspora hordei]|uniref:Putative copper export protein n=1 Tax=Saccharopolyspora hordei TaxID=1838 RepID=A0A853ATL5_9PSEU|nr:CopD family protein [Saccharopolyspora hordei]NYI85982.1 putative copper export protein [Saccharopolyspora hordei]